jgi:hypothetical protein
MDSVIAALLGAAISAFVGYFIFLRQQKIEIQRRLSEIKLRELDLDIHDFYGPLHSVTQQIFRTWEVRKKLLASKKLDEQKRGIVNQFFSDEYFWPLHLEMQKIIRSRYHLAERFGFDTHLKEYLHHSIQTTAQTGLFRKKGIETEDIKGTPWPEGFRQLVQQLLNKAINERKELVSQINKDDSLI